MIDELFFSAIAAIVAIIWKLGLGASQLIAGQGITLKDPDNMVITSGKLSLSQISVYQIENPKKGAWTLIVSSGNGGHEFYVKSSSATNVDFEHYFLIAVPGRRGGKVEVPISNPVIGKLKSSLH